MLHVDIMECMMDGHYCSQICVELECLFNCPVFVVINYKKTELNVKVTAMCEECIDRMFWNVVYVASLLVTLKCSVR